jgi:hypothetical protein
VFHGVHLGVALREGRGAVGFGNVFHARFDLGFAFKIHAAKADAGIGRSGQERHVDAIAAMEADAGKIGGTIQGLLV